MWPIGSIESKEGRIGKELDKKEVTKEPFWVG